MLKRIEVCDSAYSDHGKRTRTIRSVKIGERYGVVGITHGSTAVEYERESDGSLKSVDGIPVIATDDNGNQKIGPIVLEWSTAAWTETYDDPNNPGTPLTFSHAGWIATGGSSSGTNVDYTNAILIRQQD